MKFARIILANLLRKKVRLLLTAGSFAVALFLFMFLGMLRQAFHFWAYSAQADRLIVVNRTSYFNPIPLSYSVKIQEIPGVKFTTHSNWFPGVYQDQRNSFPEFAIDPEGERRVYPELAVPEDQWQTFLKDRQGAIAGAKNRGTFPLENR